jgi:hypothetical protein
MMMILDLILGFVLFVLLPLVMLVPTPTRTRPLTKGEQRKLDSLLNELDELKHQIENS